MEFQEKRRQQFLVEPHYRRQLDLLAEVIAGQEANLNEPEGNERGWHANLLSSMAEDKLIKLSLHYTAGEPIEPLRAELEEVIADYERYGEHLWRYTGDRNEVVFKFYSLDDYCQLMQLTGLCFLLHRRDLLPRLAALQDGENGTSNGGADTLYEEFMAFGIGPETRFETDHLCQVAPYENLFYALTETTPAKSLKELNLFLKHWYKDLAGTAWHDSHKPDEAGNQGGYYGYWSFEAGAAVLLLDIDDDTSLHKYLYYPKDLVAWARANAERFPDGGKAEVAQHRPNVPAGKPCPEPGWWFTPAQTNSRRWFTQGEIMPALGGDYGNTFWQWSPDQSAPQL